MYSDSSMSHPSCGPKSWSNICIPRLSRICLELKLNFKNPYRPNRMSKQVICVTSRKLSSLATSFIYEVSGEVMVKFCQQPILYRKVWSARIIGSTSDLVSDCRNSQTTNRLEPSSGPSESWESCLPKRYSRLLMLRPIRDWKLRICYAVVLSGCRIQQRRWSSKFRNF
jgi:hypothetical protein